MSKKAVSEAGGKYRKASFTVEAAIIVPILLMIICGVLWLGFSLHDEVRTTALRPSALEDIEAMKEIRERDFIKRIMGE